MGVTTVDIDRGYRKALAEMGLIGRSRPFVKVGIQSDAGNYPEGGPSVADVATFNEFGTSRIPERSFIRSTMDKQRPALLVMNRKLFFEMSAGRMSTRRALNILGLKITSEIKKTITRLKTPPNAPSTIRRKGSSNPLIDTGQMRQSIRHEIVLDGSD